MLFIVLTKFEMAACVKTWPSKDEKALVFYNKDAPQHNGKKGYVEAFSSKIKSVRQKGAPFVSKSSRDSKTHCSLRFGCKICKNDFVFKALKSSCVIGRDIKWTLVDPTEKSCNCFLIDTAGKDDNEREDDLDDSSMNSITSPCKNSVEENNVGSHPLAQSTPKTSKTSEKKKVLTNGETQNTPKSTITKCKGNTPSLKETAQPASNTPRRLFGNEWQEVRDAMEDFKLLIAKLPKDKALEVINIGSSYGSNVLNFREQSKANSKGGSPDTICDSMKETLCRSISMKILRYNSKSKLALIPEKAKVTGSDSNENLALQNDTENNPGKRTLEVYDDKENSSKRQKLHKMSLRKSHEITPPPKKTIEN